VTYRCVTLMPVAFWAGVPSTYPVPRFIHAAASPEALATSSNPTSDTNQRPRSPLHAPHDQWEGQRLFVGYVEVLAAAVSPGGDLVPTESPSYSLRTRDSHFYRGKVLPDSEKSPSAIAFACE
jgi:hypothetical protein